MAVEIVNGPPTLRSPRIPQEICEQIIDCISLWSHFYNRGATLCACALTCRAWYLRTRIHILNFIVNSTPAALKAFKVSMQKMRDDAKRVKRLIVWSGVGHLIPITCQHFLKNLQTLAFWSQSWDCLHPSFFIVIAQFKNLRCLELSAIRFHGLRDLTRILASLTGLKWLSIVSSIFLPHLQEQPEEQEEEQDQQQLASPPIVLPAPPSANGKRKPLPALKYFSYVDCDDEGLYFGDQSCSLLLWLAETEMTKTITTLNMEMALGRHAQRNNAARRFLDSCTSLNHLVLTKDNVHGEAIVELGFHWPKSLTAITLIMDDEQEARGQYGALAKFLSTCPADVLKNIHTLHFHTHLPYSHIAEKLSSIGTNGRPMITFEPRKREKGIWAPIDGLASHRGRAKWKALSTVKVTATVERSWGIFFASDWEGPVHGAVDLTREKDAQQFLERRLPRLCAAGVSVVPKFRMVPKHTCEEEEDDWEDS